MSNRYEYIRKMNSRLDKWSSEIYALSNKVDQTEEAIRTEYNNQIEALRSKRSAARKQLHSLEKASDSTFEDMKSGIEKAWDNIESSVNATKTSFLRKI